MNVYKRNGQISPSYESVVFFLTTQIPRVVFKQKFGSMVLSLACVAMGIHADLIRNTFDGCPISVFMDKSVRGEDLQSEVGPCSSRYVVHKAFQEEIKILTIKIKFSCHKQT